MSRMSVERSVLDAALEIIATAGPDAVSMREVARRAGVSHQAPYHYFSDRAGIFAAIATEGFETLTREFQAVLAEGSHPSQRCFEAYVRVARQHPGHFRVMFRADLCGIATHETTRGAADAAFAELLRMVDRTIGRPTDPDESLVWATLMWSTAHGLATLLIDGPLIARLSSLSSRTVVEHHIAAVLELMSQMVDKQATSMGIAPTR